MLRQLFLLIFKLKIPILIINSIRFFYILFYMFICIPMHACLRASSNPTTTDGVRGPAIIHPPSVRFNAIDLCKPRAFNKTR